jgi:CBS domain-containing protein
MVTMATVVRDLMSTPPVTCEAGTSLDRAARTMRDAGIGSVIVTDRGKVAGILTERDLLRAAAAATASSTETVEMWMTANPDVLGPEEEVDAAWTSLAHHQYRHLPVVDGHELVGVVSLRDLMGVARLRPADEHGIEVPAGLEGVVAAETAVGDVRGQEGFFHYRQYSAVELAARRSLEDVWCLLLEGSLPDRARSQRFATEVAGLRTVPPGVASMLPELSRTGSPFEVLRTAVSLLGAELGWRPTLDIDEAELHAQALRLGAVVPTILAAAHNLGAGRPVVEPRARFVERGQLPVDGDGIRAHSRARPRRRAVPDPHHRPRVQRLDLHGPRHHVDGGRSGGGGMRGHRCVVGPPARGCSQPGPRHARRDRRRRWRRTVAARRGATR